MAPVAGVGYLIANDVLTDAAFMMLQPSVNTTVPAGGIAIGSQVVATYDPSMYLGAQIVIGSVGTSGIEVVTITALVVGASFTATFANVHTAGEPITGATFPVRQTTDPLFTQPEMLAYLSDAFNDFLLEVPLVYEVNNAITVNPTQQNTALPSECMFPVRVASAGYPLRETSQSNLDATGYRWNAAAMATPRAYFRDKIPLQNIGVWPRAGNTTTLEVTYAKRQAEPLGLADGFLIPDPFCLYPLFKTLSYAFAKDGEARNVGLAKYFESRYEYGIKVSKMILEAVNDSSPQMG